MIIEIVSYDEFYCHAHMSIPNGSLFAFQRFARMLQGQPKALHTSSEQSEPDADSGDRKTDGHPFFEKNFFRNFALLVGDRRIWVNREYLGELSEVFRAMFFGGSKETRSEVELCGRKVDEIVELLGVIAPEPKEYRFEPVTRESFRFFSFSSALLMPSSNLFCNL